MAEEKPRTISTKDLNIQLALWDAEAKTWLPLFDYKNRKESLQKKALWKKQFKFGAGYNLKCHTVFKGIEYRVNIFLNEYSQIEDKSVDSKAKA